jgi:hypothetical protein
MPRTVLILLVAASVLLLLGTSQEDKKSNEKADLCSIFVSGPATDDESSVKVINEIEKKIKEKKKLFRLAEDPLEADIRIEVTQYGRTDQVKPTGRRTEGVQGGGVGSETGTVTRSGLLDIESGYFIEFLLVVPRQFKTTMTTGGRSRGSAAKEIAKKLRTICDTYCR